MNVSPEIISFIRVLREDHPRIGKEKINLQVTTQVTED